MGRGVAQIFVALGDTPKRITGYYRLSAASFEKNELPAQLSKRWPHYPIRRVVRASETIAVYAIVVDAKNDRAKEFYERYGFVAFAGAPRRLYLPLQTFKKLGL